MLVFWWLWVLLCYFYQIENCGFWRWEDNSSESSSIEVNLLKSKLEVATLKMKNLRESLSAVKIERDNLKIQLKNLESLNHFEVNKSRNLEASKLKMLCVLSLTLFVVIVVAIFWLINCCVAWGIYVAEFQFKVLAISSVPMH